MEELWKRNHKGGAIAFSARLREKDLDGHRQAYLLVRLLSSSGVDIDEPETVSATESQS